MGAEHRISYDVLSVRDSTAAFAAYSFCSFECNIMASDRCLAYVYLDLKILRKDSYAFMTVCDSEGSF